ncbi:MAG: hypothetical protein M3493_00940 [Actinomycetota bacterium]|jgi:hypothetical protein|nr:hypothetical protein [Actinomycetota bacterium]
MRLGFKELPGLPTDYLRPVAPVRVEGQNLLVAGLLDTGSLENRFGSWVAEALGLDLQAAEPVDLAIGGVITHARSIPVDLAIEGLAWRAPVSFCDPWPFGFHLLGQEGFFRFFHVSIRASSYQLDLEPDTGEAA